MELQDNDPYFDQYSPPKEKNEGLLTNKIHKWDYNGRDILTFEIDSADWFLIAIRRQSAQEIPIIAFDGKVTPIDGESIIDDHIVASRIGLIPLTYSNPNFLNFIYECKCERKGCPECEIEYSLDVVAGKTPLKVTSRDIKRVSKLPANVYLDVYDESDIFTEGIVITHLKPHENLNIKIFARKYPGKEHAKFATWNIFTFRPFHNIKLLPALNTKLTKTQKLNFIDKCPKKVFKLDSTSGLVDIEDSRKCNECNECVEYLDKELGMAQGKNFVKISATQTYTCTIESVGPVIPSLILKLTTSLMLKQLEKLREIFQKLKLPPNLQFTRNK